MLLQIAEPGQSQTKAACRRRVVGIDLGTTNSLVATVRDGSAEVLGEGPDALLPSVVSYAVADPGSGPVVGRAAVAAMERHPGATVASAKRLIGRGWADLAEVRKLLPNQLVDDGRVVRIDVGAAKVTPIEVSAEVLRELRRRAEAELGGPIEGAVITVPAYFDDAQRQATRDAGRLAGLEVMRLLAEPTAAAVAYGLDHGTRGTYAIYDLGGGTFDVSILRLVDGVFEVRATGGDSALGGDDIDRAIAQRLLDRAGWSADPSTEHGRQLATRALAAARAAKERLSQVVTTEVVLDGGRETVREPLSRVDLAEIMRPFLQRTAKACRRVLKDAELEASQLDGVVLVGGSTRSPVVRDFVHELFAREPLCALDPEKVVALGAAIQAEALGGGEQQMVLLDVVPLSLGIETMGGVVEKLIHRQTTIPCGATQTFTTYADNQTGFDIHVVQGERETVDASRSLARFQLRGIPPMVAGMARVEISFAVDADGILRVSAKELTSGIAAQVEVKPTYGLSDEEVERMLIDSYQHAEEDLGRRNLAIERIEAERILAATRAAIASDDGLLDDEVKVATEAAMRHLEAVAKADDHLAIRAAIEGLDRASKPFAQERMNRAVAAAVSGRRLDDVEGELR